MASGAAKSAAFMLLILNLLLYFIVVVIASWAMKHAIERTHETASILPTPARIFPIFFPMGNMATGLFILFALIAGVVGMTTSATGIQDVARGTAPTLHSAAASSLITLFLSLLAMGLACKEINIGWTESNLRTLEVITIIVTFTQLFCAGAIHTGVSQLTALYRAEGRI
ncbi:membrane protein PM19L-like [Punica granatum]|uniref:Membrane protein PM19L-like n=2 Tax=Punica granatum TaxID=22663 RepID=A0A6P8BXP9_PUNGR|nr:membrane protein PM19L-like [Punica granatum]XP_031395958.1 membrane protein PM19L-like [Punica granatum]OWM74188.1 hypothetical protein CDL15_Pgr008500 [Punica granatum]PKI78535.1 hypothetical protein CRG98_001093 [Punica granatum]